MADAYIAGWHSKYHHEAATVGTGGDPSHAAARRAYEKAGFDAVIPSVWMFRKL